MATQRKSGANRSKAAKAVKKPASKASPKRPGAKAVVAKAAKAKPAASGSRVVAAVKAVRAAVKTVMAKPAAGKAPAPKTPSKSPVAKSPPLKTPSKSPVAKSLPLKASSKSPVAKTLAGKAVVKGPPAKGAKNEKVAAAPAKKPVIKVVARKPPAPVRPIGVLPPEAVARANQMPAHPVVKPQHPKPRPQPKVARGQNPNAQGAQGVSEKDYKEFEQRLLEERAKILKEMGHLENTVLKVNQRESAGDLSGYSFHMADVGTDAMEREKAFLFASTEGRLLMEINEALRRVYRGEYGVCENCGKPIARARLEAMPYARLCLSCKESEERAGRGAL